MSEQDGSIRIEWYQRFKPIPYGVWVVIIDSQGNTHVGRKTSPDSDHYIVRSKRSRYRYVRKHIPFDRIATWMPIAWTANEALHSVAAIHTNPEAQNAPSLAS